MLVMADDGCYFSTSCLCDVVIATSTRNLRQGDGPLLQQLLYYSSKPQQEEDDDDDVVMHHASSTTIQIYIHD